MPHVQQKLLVVGDAAQFAFDGAVEFSRVLRRAVAKAAVLQPTPHLFHRINLRCVGRQLLQVQPWFESLDGFTNMVAFVHVAAVPNDDDSLRDCTHQHLQVCRRSLVVVVSVWQCLEEEPQRLPTSRRPPIGTGHRHLFSMPSALPQNGPLAARSPGPTNQRSHQEPTFINEDHPYTLRTRFFLSRCQSAATQAAIASSFRSRGTRSGFWHENPRTVSQRGRYRALKTILHSCRINSAIRAALQSSVANPKSVAGSDNQRRTIFSCVRVSFAGRPHGICAAKPDQPSRRKARIQRRTERASTPRKSATSSELNPSKTRCTANRRRCSSSAGEPKFRIPAIYGDAVFADITYVTSD